MSILDLGEIRHISWPGNQNLVCTATANNQEWSIDLSPGNYTGTYWHVWSGKNSKTILQCNADNNAVLVPNGILTTSQQLHADGRIRVNTAGGSWISQATPSNNAIQVNSTMVTDGGRFDGLMGGPIADGGHWSMGVLGDSATSQALYIVKYNAGRTGNGYDSGVILPFAGAGTINVGDAIKSVSRSGVKWTFTRANGGTFTVNQQDNNTTYSAGGGLSLSGTTFKLAADCVTYVLKSFTTPTTSGSKSYGFGAVIPSGYKLAPWYPVNIQVSGDASSYVTDNSLSASGSSVTLSYYLVNAQARALTLKCVMAFVRNP